MPTRLYFGTAAAAPVSPAIDAGWERQVAAFARYLANNNGRGSALADVSALFGSTATSDTAWGQWVTDTLDMNQTITGTLTLVIRVQELLGTENAFVSYVLRVVSRDGSTVRGTLKSHLDNTALEHNVASATTRLISAEALTPVAALAGDRIVLDFGVHGTTPSNTANLIHRFGAPIDVADFGATQGLSTDLVPWWELSQDITFGEPFAVRTYGPAPYVMAR